MAATITEVSLVDRGRVVKSGGTNTADNIIVQPNLSVGDCLVASDDTPFRFAYDSTTQKYGYLIEDGGADTFIPFKDGDYSQLIYENLAAANIKKDVTIAVKDPDGNILNSATGTVEGADYSHVTATNLSAANIKNGVTITVKDPNGNTITSATGSYKVNTFTNLIDSNIKKGVTITIKDSDGTTLKSVTGQYGSHTAAGSRGINGNNQTVTATIDGVQRASATASFYANTDSGNATFKYSSSDTTSHIARVTGTWSGSNYIVYVYVDGTVRASNTFTQYGTGSFSSSYVAG